MTPPATLAEPILARGMPGLALQVSEVESYTSIVCRALLPKIPQMAKIFPATTAKAGAARMVGMSAFFSHVSVAGSYTSTVGRMDFGDPDSRVHGAQIIEGVEIPGIELDLHAPERYPEYPRLV
jgi:hypothetical protein